MATPRFHKFDGIEQVIIWESDERDSGYPDSETVTESKRVATIDRGNNIHVEVNGNKLIIDIEND